MKSKRKKRKRKKLMDHKEAYKDFTERLKVLISKNPLFITTTLSNIFTMRLIGNKTHGDLAEIGIAEFVNQYMYDFKSVHVGKDLYRAKEREEDIKITNEITNAEFAVSLKAYGDGPLQLSTDKESKMFSRLKKEPATIDDKTKIKKLFEDEAFAEFTKINILPLIYREKAKQCNILVFDYERAMKDTARIVRESKGKGRKHPVYRFYDSNGSYICEVRYGSTTANALQRGLWTNTKNALPYFDSVTNGWIDYSHNTVLIKLFSHSLVSTSKGHESALEEIKKDIEALKRNSGLVR